MRRRKGTNSGSKEGERRGSEKKGPRGGGRLNIHARAQREPRGERARGLVHGGEATGAESLVAAPRSQQRHRSLCVSHSASSHSPRTDFVM